MLFRSLCLTLPYKDIDIIIRVLYGSSMNRIERRKYADRPGYLSHFVSERRRKLKKMAIEIKGGKCQLCGYNRCVWALDFHHSDESNKSFSLSTRGLTRSWALIKAEVAKCALVCANCHREIHAGVASLNSLKQ